MKGCGIPLVTNYFMKKIGAPLLKKLSRQYEASAIVRLKFKDYDLAIKTNGEGEPVLLFIGKVNSDGVIKGDRYARRLLKDQVGKVIKDHWDFKGGV